MGRIQDKHVHKDCLFTLDEIMAIKAMLYNVNTGNKCMNPAPISWATGNQWWQEIEACNRYKRHNENGE